MKEEIEREYINAFYNKTSPSVFAENILCILDIKSKKSRTNQQNRSRWKYLEMVAIVLNDQGHTYTPIGTEMNVKWTKDILYHIYWNSVRQTMYPNRKTQLTTVEFSDLVDVVMALFAQVFEIYIPFPSYLSVMTLE